MVAVTWPSGMFMTALAVTQIHALLRHLLFVSMSPPHTHRNRNNQLAVRISLTPKNYFENMFFIHFLWLKFARPSGDDQRVALASWMLAGYLVLSPPPRRPGVPHSTAFSGRWWWVDTALHTHTQTLCNLCQVVVK